MPAKKATTESAEAVSEPEVRGDPASGSEPASPEVAAEAPASEPLAAPYALAGAPARYVALRHLIRNGREYFPGDPVDMTPDPDHEANERLFADHLAELKASGAIREA